MTSKKRSLFNRPAWAKTSTGADEDLFRRSKHTYEQVKQVSQEATVQSDDAQESTSSVIRSRLSRDQDDTFIASPRGKARGPISSWVDARKRSGSADPVAQHATSSLQAHRAIIDNVQRPRSELSSKELDIVDLESPARSPSNTNPEPPRDKRAIHSEQQAGVRESFEDEDFPELARLARERARRSRLEEDVSDSSMTMVDAHLQNHDGILLQSTESRDADPIVQILVTSNIADTQPLVVNRRLSQRLRDVKLAWAQHQRPQSIQAERIFLTWRGKRVFDVVSCKNMGIKAQAMSDSDEDSRIHMVAMTKETYDLFRQSRDRQQSLDGDDDEKDAPKAETAVERQTQIRVVLQSRNFGEFKIIVKPKSTLVSNMVSGFRDSNGIDADKEILLQFDGEKLSPTSRVADTELTDLDHIEVYVK